MPFPYHGKDGRLRDHKGLIRFEYDRNDARHIRQEADHPQLGHEGQYANCVICHDYTPSTFQTYREADADIRRKSLLGALHRPREPVLSREDIAPGMDPLSLRRAPAPAWLHAPTLCQQRPCYHADPLLIAPEQSARYSESSEWTNDEPPPPRRVKSPTCSTERSIASQRHGTSRPEARNLHCSSLADAAAASSTDEIARVFRRQADIHQARASYQRGEGSHRTTALVRSFVGQVFEKELRELDMQL
jgi:hypothetical protein